MMLSPKRILTVVAVLVIGAGPLAALGDPSADELEQNRRLLDKAHRDPHLYGLLKQNLEAFRALPLQRQESMRRLDRDLHQQSEATRARMQAALERYSEWFDHLSDAQRRKIEDAPNAKARLQVIKAIREQQWVERLPTAERDKVKHLADAERAALIAELRQKEKKRRHQWQLVFLHWDELLRGPPPAHLRDFPAAVQMFVNDYLRPRLNAKEDERLRWAEGKWPGLPQTIVRLADHHPIFLPGPWQGPQRFDDLRLPPDVKQRLSKAEPRLQNAEGVWPDFAIWVTAVAKGHDILLPHPLGPCHPRDFVQPIKNFISWRLTPVLTDAEKDQLNKAEGSWPDYPRVVMELALKHKLRIPGPKARLNLPGPAAYWNKYRAQGNLGKLAGGK